jgi:hypothetical protein
MCREKEGNGRTERIQYHTVWVGRLKVREGGGKRTRAVHAIDLAIWEYIFFGDHPVCILSDDETSGPTFTDWTDEPGTRSSRLAGMGSSHLGLNACRNAPG